MPFTMMQVEDTMFVDDHTMISLEFIFYQKDAKYSLLKKSAHKNEIIHNDNQHYKDGPIQLIDPGSNFLKKDEEGIKFNRS